MIEIIAGIIAVFAFIAVPLIIILLALSIKIISEYERGVKFTLGRYDGVMNPGLNIVIPIIQSWQKVDIRTKVVDVPKQDIMTKDNISAIINAVVYFRVSHAERAVLEVFDYYYSVSQLAQTSMREVIGEINLDELLSKRDITAQKIREIVNNKTDVWGITIESVELKEIILPDELVRVISQEAEAEREKQAIILRAQGELESAKNLKDAAKDLTSVPGGIHLRTLQTIQSLGTEKSKTVIYAVPSEILKQVDIKLSLDKLLKK
ncbi:MAG: SPFH domain-containing protein [Candidatus Diapherotrites archaeon]